MPPLSRTLRGRVRAPRWSTAQGFIAGLVAGVSVTTVLAAQISFTTAGLGTGSVSVTACDSSIVIGLGNAYQTASTRFTISSVTVSSVDVACAGKTLSIVGFSGTVSTMGISSLLPAASAWPTGSAFTLSPAATIVSGSVTSTSIEIRD